MNDNFIPAQWCLDPKSILLQTCMTGNNLRCECDLAVNDVEKSL